jgi:hypothetical protein
MDAIVTRAVSPCHRNKKRILAVKTVPYSIYTDLNIYAVPILHKRYSPYVDISTVLMLKIIWRNTIVPSNNPDASLVLFVAHHNSFTYLLFKVLLCMKSIALQIIVNIIIIVIIMDR